MMMLHEYIQSCLCILITCLPHVKCPCPPQCRCSNVSAICRPGLSGFPSNLPLGISALNLNGRFATRNIITNIQASYFSALPNLKRLYMTFDRVEEIADGAIPSSLIELDISFNKIKNISGGTFSARSRLRQLHLSGNAGMIIPTSAFNGLTMLTGLYMAEMDLDVLDAKLFRSLSMLKILDIHGNNIRRLDWSITLMAPNLSYIDISGNHFTVLFNTSVMGLHKIKTINLDDNNWRCTCALEWTKILPSPISDQVVCSSPTSLQHQSLINVPSSKLLCVPASVRCTSSSITGAYHSQVNISCTMAGDPFPDVIWIRPDGAKLQYYNYDHPNYHVSELGVLSISSLGIVDDGMWKLQVNNVKKRNEQPLRVTVTDIPTTTVLPSTVRTTPRAVRTTTPNNSTSITTIITTMLYTKASKQSSHVESENKTNTIVVCVSVISGTVVITIVIIVICCALSKLTGLRFFRRRSVEELHPH